MATPCIVSKSCNFGGFAPNFDANGQQRTRKNLSNVIFNERVKLVANSLNSIGLGLIGLAVLKNVVVEDSAPELDWAILGLISHLLAHIILSMLQPD